MIRLQAALPIFYRKLVPPPSVVAFDQGPVYTMVRLQDAAFVAAEDSRLRRWWELKLDEWSRTLDLLVLLDAPNEILIERIRRRSKSHVAKTQSDEGAGELLMNERARYETVAKALGDRRVMQLLRFDTSLRSVDEITSKTMTAVRATRSVEGRL
jgi:thymidylate kinase